MGYSGACRREELTNMALGDIQYKNDIVVVSVPKTKTNVMRQFVITEKLWIDIIKKYSSIRPVNTCHQRFFVTYRSGRCITTPIGINTMGKTPRKIAEFLQLANPAQYTGHCFRRSSVSHLANSGSDLVTIKRHGGWKSSAVAEGYIETSVQRKVEVAGTLAQASKSSSSLHGILAQGCTSTHVESAVPSAGIKVNTHDGAVTVKVYNNCTFNYADKDEI
uniref:Tyr recombinase domain-containing protein n=1 Tax=Photinus pyralis TaxID=7054 RepID=A0A1Y1M6Z8_PHOPY